MEYNAAKDVQGSLFLLFHSPSFFLDLHSFSASPYSLPVAMSTHCPTGLPTHSTDNIKEQIKAISVEMAILGELVGLAYA